MPRRITCPVVLVLLAALAVPAAAAPKASGVGGIHGTVSDFATGLPLDTTGTIMVVDAFNTATRARYAQYVHDVPDGQYALNDLPVGDYKLRARYFRASDGYMSYYRWYGDAGSFRAATPITVLDGASAEVNLAAKPLRGAPVSGTLVEKGTGLPLTDPCLSIMLYESGGIPMGLVLPVDGSGAWTTGFFDVPVGRWTVLAWSQGSPVGDTCTGPITHLDTWYGGASAWPMDASSPWLPLSGEHFAATFPTADVFAVHAGVPVTDITIKMRPAPTCRGKVPTAYGTTLADVIIGTPARDVVVGLGGADRIYGRGSRDILCGNGGDDLIKGGPGFDTAAGGRGTDTCVAEHLIGCP